jgi:hypothetical protein
MEKNKNLKRRKKKLIAEFYQQSQLYESHIYNLQNSITLKIKGKDFL